MMNEGKMKKLNIRPYLQALPVIFNSQIVTKVLLGVWLFLLGRVFQALLKSSGRVAVTSGDWKFLFTTWQGILILLLSLVSLFIYVAIDLDSKIVVSRNILTGRKATIRENIREGYNSTKKLFSLRGILVMLYIALIAPVLGIGISLSMTKGLYIPTFIASFIEGDVLYSALAGVLCGFCFGGCLK